MEKLFSHRALALGVLLMAAAGYIGLLIVYSNSDYPLISNDYRYFLPHLLDAHLHYKLNGFIIQWYTPTFGGGLPAYPNPQAVQFTLPQLYMLVLNPWQAILAASATFIAIGFIAAYYFFSRLLNLNPFASTLGAILFNANGFVFARVVVGHIGYHSFPLLAVLLVALTHPRWPALIKGAIIGSITGILLHSGGFYFVLIFGLSLLIVLPICLLIKPDMLPAKPLIFALLYGALFSVLLTASKIYAVTSHMREFPRVDLELYDVNIVLALASVIFQFFAFTTILPLFTLFGSSYFRMLHLGAALSGAQDYIWEIDMSLSPVLIPLLGMGLFLIRSNIRQIKKQFNWKKAGLITLSLIGVWLTAEFRLTKGLIYPAIQNLPILQSLHVNFRFAAAYILPLSVIGAWIFEHAQLQFTEIQKRVVFVSMSLISIAAFLSYFLVGPEWFYINYDVRNVEAAYRGIEDGNTYPITQVLENDDSLNSLLLLNNATDINPYEPVFGYGLEAFDSELTTGSVWTETDGYFNMTNPASLVYPQENSTYAFERIKVSERQRMEEFVNHRQPDWTRPPLQSVLDYLMAAGFFIVLALLLGYFGFDIAKRIRGQRITAPV